MSQLSKRFRNNTNYELYRIESPFKIPESDLFSRSNESGIIDLSVAENRLSSSLVAERLARVPPVQESYLGYSARCEESMARFAEKYITKYPIAPDNLLVTCGASGAIDRLTYMLCDPGDELIVISPGYKGFKVDTAARNKVRVVPVQLSVENEFRTTLEAIQTKWNTIADTSKVRAIILSSPGNPSGEVLTSSVIRDIVFWARNKNIHVIFDEIYALSVFSKESKFVSVAQVLENQLGDDVHIIWSFSKDFCASGVRAGILISQNREIINGLKPLVWFGGLSSLAGWALTDVLSDVSWINYFVEENNRRISEAYERVTVIFKQHDINFIRAEAAFFLIVDLTRFLDGPPSYATEMALFSKIKDAGVVLLPCCQVFSKSYGYFRMVYGAVEMDVLDVALNRLINVLVNE